MSHTEKKRELLAKQKEEIAKQTTAWLSLNVNNTNINKDMLYALGIKKQAW